MSLSEKIEILNKVSEKYNKIGSKLKKAKKELLKAVYEYSLVKLKESGVVYKDYKQHNFDIEDKFSLITTYGGLDRYLIEIWFEEDYFYALLKDSHTNSKLFGKYEVEFKDSSLDGLINLLSVHCKDSYPYELE